MIRRKLCLLHPPARVCAVPFGDFSCWDISGRHGRLVRRPPPATRAVTSARSEPGLPRWYPEGNPLGTSWRDREATEPALTTASSTSPQAAARRTCFQDPALRCKIGGSRQLTKIFIGTCRAWNLTPNQPKLFGACKEQQTLCQPHKRLGLSPSLLRH
jgi:hypothetical protein